jgi:hypothetical protein
MTLQVVRIPQNTVRALRPGFEDWRPPLEIKFGTAEVIAVSIFKASAGGFIPAERRAGPFRLRSFLSAAGLRPDSFQLGRLAELVEAAGGLLDLGADCLYLINGFKLSRFSAKRESLIERGLLIGTGKQRTLGFVGPPGFGRRGPNALGKYDQTSNDFQSVIETL